MYTYLAIDVFKKFVDVELDLLEEDGVDGGAELIGHELLDVPLYLGAKLVVAAHEQLEEVRYEPASHHDKL